MGKASFIITDDKHKALQEYLTYKDNQLKIDITVFSESNMDHNRLPANIDITEFLIYMKFRFLEWLQQIGYKGETPNFEPAFSDTILSRTGDDIPITQDSPHSKIPWSIAYRVKRRMPMSKQPPFGKDKHWKYRYCGYFKDKTDNFYEVRMKEWEHLIEFIIVSRSNIQVDILTRTFEDFIMTNHGYFQAAGLAAMRPLGRTDEAEQKLDDTGLHYRKTHFWAHSQEFFMAGPFTEITNIAVDTVIPDF